MNQIGLAGQQKENSKFITNMFIVKDLVLQLLNIHCCATLGFCPVNEN